MRKSKTQQHFAPGLSINAQIRRYRETGVFANTRPAQFMDLTEAPDLKTALDLERETKKHFLTLPAEIRRAFRNNMVTFSRWIRDPKNFNQAVKLGLLETNGKTSSEVPLTAEAIGKAVRDALKTEPAQEDQKQH